MLACRCNHLQPNSTLSRLLLLPVPRHLPNSTTPRLTHADAVRPGYQARLQRHGASLVPAANESAFPALLLLLFPLVSAAHVPWRALPQASTNKTIEDEVAVDSAPTTLLRPDGTPDDSMRVKFEKMIREAQDSIVAAVEVRACSVCAMVLRWSRGGVRQKLR